MILYVYSRILAYHFVNKYGSVKWTCGQICEYFSNDAAREACACGGLYLVFSIITMLLQFAKLYIIAILVSFSFFKVVIILIWIKVDLR